LRLTVLGGCGAWPDAGQACSGYLLEEDGFRVLLDPGYAVVPRLLSIMPAHAIDAVLVTHGHPDHCADLNPLLRARALQVIAAAPLPVYALPGALNAVLRLDRPQMLADACQVHDFRAGDQFEVGPFTVATCLLPHWLPNAGLRLSSRGKSLAYTGDSGPSPDIARWASGVDVFLAEATYVADVPAGDAAYLSSARDCGLRATVANVRRLVLTHLWPGTDPAAARASAQRTFAGPIEVARKGLVTDLSA
jgi:ribonuclease BN (tRNA processing enzyme)